MSSVTTDGEDVLAQLPRYQVAHAARIGITDPDAVIEFITANHDQPDHFWFHHNVEVLVGKAQGGECNDNDTCEGRTT